MNDRRVAVTREALDLLVDSIAATSRLKRWDAADSVPESLATSAQLLDKRLDAASKLAGTSFVGGAQVVSRLNGISEAIRRLDRACTDFRAHVEREPAELNLALDALDAEVDQVKAISDDWG